MVSGFFWREKGLAATPLSPASPEGAPPLPGVRQFDAKAKAPPGDLGIGGVIIGGDGIDGKEGVDSKREEPAPPHPWEKPKVNHQKDTLNEVKWINVCYSA